MKKVTGSYVIFTNAKDGFKWPCLTCVLVVCNSNHKDIKAASGGGWVGGGLHQFSAITSHQMASEFQAYEYQMNIYEKLKEKNLCMSFHLPHMCFLTFSFSSL